MRLAQTARTFAERGFEVFPLAEDSKMPLKGSAGYHDAVADPIDAYCSFLSGNPNIGLSMKGKLGLDFDAHKGGLETLAELKDRLPATYVQSTPNGGQHWVYKLLDGVEVPNSVEKIGRGVDVRGAGGHLVGAGSQVDGKPYTVVSDLAPTLAPDWLIELAGIARAKASNAGQVIGELDTESALRFAETYLQTAPIAVERSGGDLTTIKVANKVMDGGVSPEACLDLMLRRWNDRCLPPWDADDLEAKVQNAARYRQKAIGSDNPAAGLEPATLPAGPVAQASYESRCVADVEMEPVNWLWPERFALGKLSIIGGQPKRGKSQITCAIAATVTNGGLWPDGTRAPLGSVIFITAEDDLADTIKPRLIAAGANVRKVYMFDWALSGGKKKHFEIGAHMPQLTEMIDAIGDVRLVVIDPVLAYMGAADSHKTAEVRSALMPLQALAPCRNFAGLLVTHFNKNEAGASAMNRMAASGAYAAVARSVWVLEYDPEDPTQTRRTFCPGRRQHWQRRPYRLCLSG